MIGSRKGSLPFSWSDSSEEGIDRQLQGSSYILNNRKWEKDSGNELLDKNEIKNLVLLNNRPLSMRRSSCEIWKVSISVEGEPWSPNKIFRRLLNYQNVERVEMS